MKRIPRWWVIQDGQIRFSIDGQSLSSPPSVTWCRCRTATLHVEPWARPSLRSKISPKRADVPYDENRSRLPIRIVPVRLPGKACTPKANKPFVDFNAVAAGTDKTRRFVHDDRAVANIIIGPGIPPPPLTNKGHFHPESGEFWFILLNKIRYNIEGLPVFEADQGDIVYVPKMRFHLASFGGNGPSCRLAMNGYTDLSHSSGGTCTIAAPEAQGSVRIPFIDSSAPLQLR